MASIRASFPWFGGTGRRSPGGRAGTPVPRRMRIRGGPQGRAGCRPRAGSLTPQSGAKRQDLGPLWGFPGDREGAPWLREKVGERCIVFRDRQVTSWAWSRDTDLPILPPTPRNANSMPARPPVLKGPRFLDWGPAAGQGEWGGCPLPGLQALFLPPFWKRLCPCLFNYI